MQKTNYNHRVSVYFVNGVPVSVNPINEGNRKYECILPKTDREYTVKTELIDLEPCFMPKDPALPGRIDIHNLSKIVFDKAPGIFLPDSPDIRLYKTSNNNMVVVKISNHDTRKKYTMYVALAYNQKWVNNNLNRKLGHVTDPPLWD